MLEECIASRSEMIRGTVSAYSPFLVMTGTCGCPVCAIRSLECPWIEMKRGNTSHWGTGVYAVMRWVSSKKRRRGAESIGACKVHAHVSGG